MADPSKLHPANEVTPEGRRQFLRCAAVTGASALVPASLLSACAAAMSFQGVVADGRVRVPADQLAQIEEDAGLLVNAPGLQEKIWLIRSEGEWLAIGAECSHLSCQVRPRGGFIACKCHGSTFILDGRVVRGPATEPLRRYAVKDIAADVEIEIR